MNVDDHEHKKASLVQMLASSKQLRIGLKLQHDLLNQLKVLPSARKNILISDYRQTAVSDWNNSFLHTLKLFFQSVTQQLHILGRYTNIYKDILSTPKFLELLERMIHNIELQKDSLENLPSFPSTFPQDVLKAPRYTNLDIESTLKVWENSITENLELLSLLLKEQDTNLDSLKNILDEKTTSLERPKTMTSAPDNPMTRKQGIFPVSTEYETNWLNYPHDELYIGWEKSLDKESIWEKVKKRLSHFDSCYENYLFIAMAVVGVPCDSWEAMFTDICAERRGFKGLSKTLWEDSSGGDQDFWTQRLTSDPDNPYNLVFPPLNPVWLVKIYRYDQYDYLEELTNHWDNILEHYWIPWETQLIPQIRPVTQAPQTSTQKRERAMPKVSRTPSAIDKILEIGEEGRRQIDLTVQHVNSQTS